MTVASMTGYGFGKHQNERFSYTCEIKSLNSRFLEANIRLPRGHTALEAPIIRQLKSLLERGKVDLFIEIEPLDVAESLPALDEDVATHYLEQWQKANKLVNRLGFSTHDKAVINISDLMKMDGVLGGKGRKKQAESVEQHADAIKAVVEQGVASLKESRLQEGANLASALEALVTDLSNHNHAVRKILPEVRKVLCENWKKRLESAVEKIQNSEKKVGLPPEERLTQELGILLDKQDIEEEITRLNSHVDRFGETLKLKGGVGRKLDFLCQEMHREVNTMTNKAIQTEISNHTLQMKQVVEQIRQQVQNVE